MGEQSNVINVRAFAIACVCVLLQACGGGGGGGTPNNPGGNSGNGSFTLSANSASFRILAMPGQAFPDQMIDMTVTNTRNVAGVSAAFPAGQGVPNWFHVSITGTMPNFQVRLTSNSFTPAGHYTATLLLRTGDANGAVLSSREVAVTMDVIAPVGVDTAPFSANFVSAARPSVAMSRQTKAHGPPRPMCHGSPCLPALNRVARLSRP